MKTFALLAVAAALALAAPTAHAQDVPQAVLTGTVESLTPHSLTLRHGPWEDTLIITPHTIASNGIASVPLGSLPLQGAQVRVRAALVPGLGLVAAIVEIPTSHFLPAPTPR